MDTVVRIIDVIRNNVITPKAIIPVIMSVLYTKRPVDVLWWKMSWFHSCSSLSYLDKFRLDAVAAGADGLTVSGCLL